MQAEERKTLADAMARSEDQGPIWIEQLIAAGNEVGGVELELPHDQPATSADLSEA